MGAYLSQPKTDKVSTDEFNELLTVGASSMQGWRNSQEDAHNSILDFDTNTSFFAVYDGHGGAEVATYCADRLPQFLKELQSYKNEELELALKEAFLGFDRTLLEPQVIELLKVLAGEKNFMDGDDSDAHDDDEDVEDLVELHEESNLPLNEVLEKYKGGGLSMPSLKRVKDGAAGAKPQSPYLRGRRAAAVAADAANKAVMDPDAKPKGSSTSAAAAASSNDAGPSSSNATAISKMDTDEPEEDSTVSSSSSSASKSNINNNNNNNSNAMEAESIKSSVAEAQNVTTNGATPATSTTASSTVAAAAAVVASAANCVTAADSSHMKEIEQNGSVTSSQTKSLKADVSTTGGDVDATVSGSSDVGKRIQNGTVGSTSSTSSSPAASKSAADATAISSTSKEAKRGKKMEAFGEDESTDDDADYDAENSSAEENDASHAQTYSSEEDEVEDAENSSVDYSTDEELEEDDDEDEDNVLANEEFCANMIEEPGKDSGCTAVVALLRGRDLYVANAGDSRCVVCRNGVAVDMSLDHKPEDEEESDRIVKAGGRVTLDGRVNGGLNLSRAIGDHAYKMNLELPAEAQMISALPDIRKLIVTPEDEFMVLACDGIWNFMTSEEVVQFVRLRLKDESKQMSQICEELFDHCLAPNTIGDGTGCDNMTAVIVRFERKLLEMPTKINPAEVVGDAANAGTQQLPQTSLKRSASPASDDNSNNEPENANKTKRLKTDEDTSSTTTSTNTTAAPVTVAVTASSSEAAASSSSTLLTSSVTSAAEEAAAVNSIVVEQKECDSDAAGAGGDAAAAVSST